MPPIQNAENENQCQCCGTVYSFPVRYHSGVRECGLCWDWRKLDGPMARYWNERINALFEQGPDLYDYQTWSRMEMRDEMVEALNTLEAFRVRCEIAIEGSDRRSALGYGDINNSEEM